MSSKCVCLKCAVPVDCGDVLCGVCDAEGFEDKPIREVKPGLWLVQKIDQTFGLKWLPDMV